MWKSQDCRYILAYKKGCFHIYFTCELKEIAENVKKTQHNRSPSSASNTSLEVAQITGSADGDSDTASVTSDIPLTTPSFAKVQGIGVKFGSKMYLILKVLVHKAGYENLFFFVNIFDFQKLMFFKILSGNKLYALIHFDRKHFIFMKF